MREKFHKNRLTYNGKAVGFKCDEIILPDGKPAVREYLVHPGAVAILPFLDSPKNKNLLDCRVIMVQQYRYPVALVTEELPAGKLDPKESKESCLKRELKEETGYSASRFSLLTSYWPTPAFSDEVIHIYWATDLKAGKSNPDDDEFINAKVMKFGEVLRKVKTGKIRDSKTVIGILCAAQFLR